MATSGGKTGARFILAIIMVIVWSAEMAIGKGHSRKQTGRMQSTPLRTRILLVSLAVVLLSVPGSAQTPAVPRDGQHDFDFEIGDWKTHVKRLQHPLTGSSA